MALEQEYGMPDIFSFVWLQREKEVDEIIIPSHFSKKRTMEKRNVVSNLCGSLSRSMAVTSYCLSASHDDVISGPDTQTASSTGGGVATDSPIFAIS